MELEFRYLAYIRHNQRRQEHLATLGLDLFGKRVLELGAGIGDHSTFFLDRKCSVLAVEAREENCKTMSQSFGFEVSGYRFPVPLTIWCGTVEEAAEQLSNQRFDIVYCYGLLYHVTDPTLVLKFAADVCDSLLLLETCVTYGSHEAINVVQENASSITQAMTGTGCRPTRPWIFNRLKELFGYAYMPATQPCHEEFPLDWTAPPSGNSKYTRAIFVGSKTPLDNPLLIPGVPDRQRWG